MTNRDGQGCILRMRIHHDAAKGRFWMGTRGFRRLMMSLVVLGSMGGMGCAGNSKNPPVPKVLKHPVTADRIRPLDSGSGKVVRSDSRLKFVVLDFTLTAVPQPGQRLEVVRDGESVGELRVTGPASNTMTVADLVAGQAQSGDAVRPK